MKEDIDRRRFIKKTSMIATGVTILPSVLNACNSSIAGNPVRLGAPVPGSFSDPVEWVKIVKSLGYSAAYCPVGLNASQEQIKAFRREATRSNIMIAEVGVWNNMLDPDEAKRKEAIEMNIRVLQLADQIGAGCCVNISGARGEIWDGPYSGNYSKETFEMIVENVRHIIDEAKPEDAFYTLETMPYMLPDSPDSYLSLIKAIGRKQFAAHLDPVNMISSPQKYYDNAAFIRECFNKLGPFIKSIHAKDIIIMPELTLHLEERRPGLGALDYSVFLKETSKLKGVPVMLEHLETQDDYKLAAEYVRQVGKNEGIEFLIT
jgi:sugar phosphate isomerase/epimerase